MSFRDLLEMSLGSSASHFWQSLKHKRFWSRILSLQENQQHAFSDLVKKVEKAKQLSGPVYLDVDVKHNFSEFQKHAENIQNLSSPIYLSENTKHSFGEISKQIETLKSMSGPVYLQDSKSNYNEILTSCYC